MTAAVKRPDTSSVDHFVSLWGLPTTEQRVIKRVGSSLEELREFYDAMLPLVRPIVEYLNQFPLSSIPDADRPLANATLALCEIDQAVNKWKNPTLDTSMDICLLTEKSSAYERTL